jgi:hypothetical protein
MRPIGVVADRRAASTGVRVMLALAATLAVVGMVVAFVLVQGQAAADPPSTQWEWDGETADNGSYRLLRVTHDGGETVDASRLSFALDGPGSVEAGGEVVGADRNVVVGTALVAEPAGGEQFHSNGTVQLRWGNGDQTTVLSSHATAEG